MEITISTKKITRFLLFVVLGLALASIAGQISKYFLGDSELFGFVSQFNLASEKNVPTYYSGLTLLFCSLLLGAIAFSKKKANDRYARHWQGLSLIFFYLALDEVLIFHEGTAQPLRAIFKRLGLSFLASGIFYFAWVILGAAFVLIVFIAYAKFLAELPDKTRRLFFVAGTIFVVGALGVEMLESYWVAMQGKENFVYAIMATVEELLEMLGIIIFIYALLSYMSSQLKEMRILINSNEPESVKSTYYQVRGSEQQH
ncbi:MAG: hypothetical protein AB1861_26530 [Cyanobacteriota bacterium]